jgi:hypothetical protein
MHDDTPYEDILAAANMYNNIVTKSTYWQLAAKEADRIGAALTGKDFDAVFSAYATNLATIEQCVQNFVRKQQTRVLNETI